MVVAFAYLCVGERTTSTSSSSSSDSLPFGSSPSMILLRPSMNLSTSSCSSYQLLIAPHNTCKVRDQEAREEKRPQDQGPGQLDHVHCVSNALRRLSHPLLRPASRRANPSAAFCRKSTCGVTVLQKSLAWSLFKGWKNSDSSILKRPHERDDQS